MTVVWCTDLQSRPTEFLAFTSWTLDEFQLLLPPFEAAFQAHMSGWRLDGKPRTARRCTVYAHCPLPTPEDRRLGLLASLKTSALQGVQGRVCGMGQSQAPQWRHVLLPVRLTALRARGDAPARSLTALAPRLGVAEADAAPVITPLEEEPALGGTDPAVAPGSPLVPMTGRHGASSAPKTLRNRPHVRAARKRITPSTMSCWSMRCSCSSGCATPTAAASLSSAWPTRPRIPGPPGAGCDRLWASWRSRCPRWGSFCRRRNHAAGN